MGVPASRAKVGNFNSFPQRLDQLQEIQELNAPAPTPEKELRALRQNESLNRSWYPRLSTPLTRAHAPHRLLNSLNSFSNSLAASILSYA